MPPLRGLMPHQQPVMTLHATAGCVDGNLFWHFGGCVNTRRQSPAESRDKYAGQYPRSNQPHTGGNRAYRVVPNRLLNSYSIEICQFADLSDIQRLSLIEL